MKYFLSIGAASFWLLVFAVACAVATIIETVYNTEVAWAMVYNTLWFGGIMVLLGINLAYNIVKYNLIKIKKIPAFLFHFSFLFILLGAILTRYFGFEGNIHIRENESSNQISTRDIYIQLIAHDDKGEFVRSDTKNYLSLTGRTNFDLSLPYKGKTANLTYKNSIANGSVGWVEGGGGEPRVEFLFSNSKDKRNVSLKQGENI
ncbi:MAG: cytochrome c biogenesis protein ResB, partial [Campylobacter sp.]|nr:cytochrome c biogenesis protein ResB [Campylobacter sp.]